MCSPQVWSYNAHEREAAGCGTEPAEAGETPTAAEGVLAEALPQARVPVDASVAVAAEPASLVPAPVLVPEVAATAASAAAAVARMAGSAVL